MTAAVFHDQLIETLPALRAFAMMLTRDRSAGEDLVQDTVLRALDKSEHYTLGTNLRAWLYTIMRNQFINGLRRRQRERLTDIDEDLMDNLDAVAANQEHVLVLKLAEILEEHHLIELADLQRLRDGANVAGPLL